MGHDRLPPRSRGDHCFSSAYIESPEDELERADLAVVVRTADDTWSVCDRTVNRPRNKG